MFSLKKWNLDEYKEALREISDPVERMNEINGGMFIGLPIISLICSIIIWGIG